MGIDMDSVGLFFSLLGIQFQDRQEIFLVPLEGSCLFLTQFHLGSSEGGHSFTDGGSY